VSIVLLWVFQKWAAAQMRAGVHQFKDIEQRPSDGGSSNAGSDAGEATGDVKRNYNHAKIPAATGAAAAAAAAAGTVELVDTTSYPPPLTPPQGWSGGEGVVGAGAFLASLAEEKAEEIRDGMVVLARRGTDWHA